MVARSHHCRPNTEISSEGRFREVRTSSAASRRYAPSLRVRTPGTPGGQCSPLCQLRPELLEQFAT